MAPRDTVPSRDMVPSKDSVDTDISRDRLGCLLETEFVCLLWPFWFFCWLGFGRVFIVWMFELQAIATLAGIYLLSVISCYAALKAQCHTLFTAKQYTFNASEICFTNSVCHYNANKLSQTNLAFPSENSGVYGEAQRLRGNLPLRTEPVLRSQNVHCRTFLSSLGK